MSSDSDSDIDAMLAKLNVSEERLRKMIEFHAGFVKKMTSERPRMGWMPMLEVLMKPGPDEPEEVHICALDVPFNEHEDKHEMMRRLGRKYYEDKKLVMSIILSAECWMSSQRPGTKAPHCEPRHDPAREELVIVTGMALTMGDRALGTSAPVFRYKKSNNMRLGEFSEVHPVERAALLMSFFGGFMETVARKIREAN